MSSTKPSRDAVLASCMSSDNTNKPSREIQSTGSSSYDLCDVSFSRSDKDDAIVSPLPVALTTRPRSQRPLQRNIQSPPSEQNHLRQQSLSSLTNRPLTTPTNRAEAAITKQGTEIYDSMPLTGDERRKPGGTKSTGWFGGNAFSNTLAGTEHNAGTIARHDRPRSHRNVSFESKSSVTIDTTPARSMPSGSRFGFFSPKSPSPPVQISSSLDDEYLSLDIGRTLFPAGPPTERDPFSPAAFKNLQMNAEGALSKLQHAYQQRAVSLHEALQAKGAQTDDLEEAEMRARHFKLQLEDMARRVAEKEAEMERLMADLAQEKRLREEEAQARDRSSKAHSRGSSIGVKPSMELDREVRKREWRKSNGTVLSYDSEDDGESTQSDSIFSRSRSPSPTFTTSTSISEQGGMSPPSLHMAKSVEKAEPLQVSTPPTQPGAFQRMFRGIRTVQEEVVMGPDRCSNCRGNDAQVAWDTVDILKAENKGLKDRVGELEDAVDGALDMVLGVGMRRAL